MTDCNRDILYNSRGYGSTELGVCLFRTPWTDDKEFLEKTVGKPPSSHDVRYRIRHMTEDRYCELEEEGEIEVLSPLRMQNYWHNRDQPPMGWVRIKNLALFRLH